MRESRAGAGDRRLFQFLAASRPQGGRRGAAAALAASVAGHGVLIGLAAWTTIAAAHQSSAPRMTVRDQVVVLLSPRQSLEMTKHAFARSSTRIAEDARGGERDAEAAPSADPAPAASRPAGRPVRAFVEILAAVPPPLPDATVVIEDVARQADHVLVSLRESEYGGIGFDSATTRVATILDDHHEPTVEQLELQGPHISGSFTAAPELANPDQVRRFLSRDYPPLLKDSGVGGRVLLWFLVDEGGHVRRWLLKASSGHAALDKVALRAASMMRFRPAWNFDRHVPLWIVLPITFVVDAG